MYNRHAANIYKRTQVETVDQKTLIVMCYREAIESLQRGRDCYLRKDLEEKTRQFSRAGDFISELLSSLNLETGGMIAQNLSSIYNFALRHIMEGDLKGDMKVIEDVIGMLSELRSTWEQIGTKPDMNKIQVSKNRGERSHVSLSVGI